MSNLNNKFFVFLVFLMVCIISFIPSLYGKESIRNVDIKQSNNETFGAVFYASDDAYVDQENPNVCFGDSRYLLVRNATTSMPFTQMNLLIKFDLQSIPLWREVCRATLNIWYGKYENVNPHSRDLELFKNTENWSEHNITWNSQPNHDINVSASTKIPLSCGEFMSWNVTADVQGFHNGGKENFGWKLLDRSYYGTDAALLFFLAKEMDINPPYLEIEFNEVPVRDRYTDLIIEDIFVKIIELHHGEILRSLRVKIANLGNYSAQGDISVKISAYSIVFSKSPPNIHFIPRYRIFDDTIHGNENKTFELDSDLLSNDFRIFTFRETPFLSSFFSDKICMVCEVNWDLSINEYYTSNNVRKEYFGHPFWKEIE